MKKFLKTYKEELLVIPMLMFGFYLLNWLLSSLYPNSAFFDFSSQMETIYFRLISVVVNFAFAWVALRITFPQVYSYLREEFYHNFEDLPGGTKRKYAVVILLVFILCAALSARSVGAENSNIRGKLIKTLELQLNVRETAPNQGYMVDKYLHSVGVDTPAPWCAAFVSYNLQQYNIPNPKSAWSPHYALEKDVIYKAKRKNIPFLPGDVVTYYYPKLGRVGHVGFYCQKDPSGYLITIEGNTNSGGSREGDGVYKKKRELSKVYAISRYIK